MLEFLQMLYLSTVEVPAYEISGLLLLVTICLILRTINLGLLVTYLFSFSLSWKFFGERASYQGIVFYLFTIIGVAIFLIAIWYMIADKRKK